LCLIGCNSIWRRPLPATRARSLLLLLLPLLPSLPTLSCSSFPAVQHVLQLLLMLHQHAMHHRVLQPAACAAGPPSVLLLPRATNPQLRNL
jgi:hypothetical protein